MALHPSRMRCFRPCEEHKASRKVCRTLRMPSHTVRAGSRPHAAQAAPRAGLGATQLPVPMFPDMFLVDYIV